MNSFIKYLPAENVLVCSECRHALTIGRLERHLREKHHIGKPRSTSIIRHLETIANSAISPDEVCYATIVQNPPPVPYADLEGPVNGFACRHCPFATPNLKHVQHHTRTVHAVRGTLGLRKQPQNEKAYHEAHLQTFFQALSELRWFQVQPRPRSPPAAALENPLKRMLDDAWTDLERSRRAATGPYFIEEAEHKSQITPWLRKTGWVQYLDGLRLQDVVDATKTASRNHVGTGESAVLGRIQAAVEEMMATCTTVIPNLSTIGKRHLGNFSGGSDSRLLTKPFSLMQETVSRQRYISHWSRFILYVVRVVYYSYLERPEDSLLKLTPYQERCLDDVLEIATSWDGMVDAKPKLEEAVKIASRSFVKQRLQRNPYESPLVSYTAARGISATNQAWLEPESYTPFLAGLVWDTQLIVAEDCWDQSLGNDDFDLDDCLEKVSRLWLSNTKSSPVSVLLDLQLYGSSIANQRSKIGKIYWSHNGSFVHYEEKVFAIEELRRFFGKLLDVAESTLMQDLLFASEEPKLFLRDILSASKLSDLNDNPNQTKNGYSFFNISSNNLTALSDIVKHRVNPNQAFVRKDGVLCPTDEHHRLYSQAVDKFLEYMMLIFYFTGGAPPRSTELVGLTWKNTDVCRNTFIYDGSLLFRLTYNKTQSMLDSSRPICRFLPVRASRIFLLYLAAVVPYLAFLESLLGREGFVKSPFVLADNNGKVWSATKVHSVFRKLSQQLLGKTLTVSIWRHIAEAIGKKHLRLRSKELGMTRSDDEDSDDNPFALQFGHSENVGRRIYGRETYLGSQLSKEDIDEWRAVSQKFQRFFHVHNDLSPAQTTALTLQKSTTPTSSARPTKEAVSLALRQLYGERFAFRSEVQSSAVTMLVEGTVKELVVVMPTGGGKSVLFLLPPLVEDQSHLTVVVVPLRALVTGIGNRFAKAQVDFLAWNAEMADIASGTSVMIVSVELSVSAKFRSAIARALVEGRQVRFVFDECHLMITQQAFRPVFRDLVLLRDFDQCQQIFLTATLPPSLRHEFESAMLLRSPRYFRQLTRRPNISYNVFIGADAGAVDDKLAQLVDSANPNSSTVVYCHSKQDTRFQAGRLGCDYFYSDSPNGEEVLDRWLQGDVKTIVATGALGLGVDLATIDLVIHYGIPYGLIDFAQESGRAGRANQQAASWVLSCTYWESIRAERAKAQYWSWDRNVQRMQDWMVSDRCRREHLDAFMDGAEPVTCGTLNPDEALCDICSSGFTEQGEPVGAGPASISEPGQVEYVAAATSEPHFISEPTFSESVLTSAVKANAARVDKLCNEVLPKYQGVCRLCMFFQKRACRDHVSLQCPEPKNRWQIQRLTTISQKKVRFPDFAACFDCGLPQTFCDKFGSEGETDKPCQYRSLVSEFLSIGLNGDWQRQRIFSHMKEEEALANAKLDPQLEWAAKKTMVLGRSSCKAFEVMLSLLELNGEL